MSAIQPTPRRDLIADDYEAASTDFLERTGITFASW